MKLSPIRSEQTVRQGKEAVVLRDGQIIQGKITKLFPNNRAEIQIGGHKTIAQLTTALSVGERYFFQVQHHDQIVQLKVVSEPLKQDSSVNVMHLLEQLGMKVSKENIQLVQALIGERIPFERDQLIQMERLLSRASDKANAIDVLKQMAVNRLPMNENIFQALLATKSMSMNDALKGLMLELQQLSNLTKQQQQLLALLQQLLVQKGSVESIVTANMQGENETQFTQLLKLINVINMQVSGKNVIQQEAVQSLSNRGAWMDALSTIVRQEQSLQLPALRISSIYYHLQHGGLTDEQFQSLRSMITEQILPYVHRETGQVMQQLMSNSSLLNQQQLYALLQTLANGETYEIAQQMTSQLNEVMTPQSLQAQLLAHIKSSIQSTGMLHENHLKTMSQQAGLAYDAIFSTLVKNSETIRQNSEALLLQWQHRLQMSEPLQEQQFTLLQEQIREQLVPLLQGQHGQFLLEGLMNNNEQLLQLLRLFAGGAMYEQIEQLMLQHGQGLTKEHVQEIKSLIQTIHIPVDESNVRQTIMQSAPTIKSLLIQMIQQGETLGSERGQQLVHFINGLQIQSIQESNNFMQAQIHLPAEKLGLNKDLFLQFEGKKKENGKLDEDYCRILFVLHLQHLNETIVDMHVQKRTVSVTIFNEANVLEADTVAPLKSMLANGLQNLNFRLTSIRWKPLHEQVASRPVHDLRQVYRHEEIEGYDFRI